MLCMIFEQRQISQDLTAKALHTELFICREILEDNNQDEGIRTASVISLLIIGIIFLIDLHIFQLENSPSRQVSLKLCTPNGRQAYAPSESSVNIFIINQNFNVGKDVNEKNTKNFNFFEAQLRESFWNHLTWKYWNRVD